MDMATQVTALQLMNACLDDLIIDCWNRKLTLAATMEALDATTKYWKHELEKAQTRAGSLAIQWFPEDTSGA